MLSKAKNKILQFFKESYKLSPFGFYIELIEAVFYIAASIILAITILDPLTEVFIPMFLVASTTGFISTVIRKASFTIILTGWGVIVYTYAAIQLFIL